ncbi:urease accessory protein UreE [Mangrovibrevibacter kandeliae]|uniref:urease accessory protein UreE n=1 Tax=Mangrovibrevibacter kandeliae TaxID=2968473 RepID=UPI002119AE8B|nr:MULTISPECIES: urease accessory protein UreE [unclassified Aurantimonas]MCQ8783190.1 urease accessory protein UreE [Aurantimonas sp. CSK15Z-1]MCW4115564.1 urease accessory protein UreE [Aurantimonas sp. MSK8Z-1]
MIVAESVRRKGDWDGAADTITLDEQARHRRRMAMVSDGGIAFLLDLPEALLLREGDGILLDDGRIVEVRAKPEPLYAVSGRDAGHLLSLAWHLGNRHQAAQVSADGLLIRQDPVIRDMLLGLGARVEEVEAAFDPEGGAYAHSHDQDAAQAHGVAHEH